MVHGSSSSSLAFDLTSAGAPPAWQRDRDPQTEAFITARLAGLAKLIDQSGADLITLGGDFRLGGRRKRDDFLDGALALSRVGQHTSSVRLAAAIPVDQAGPQQLRSTLSAVDVSTANRAGWVVENRVGVSGIEMIAQSLGTGPHSPTVVVNIEDEADISLAAAHADVARLRVTTVEEGRNLRSRIKTKAQQLGRQAEDIDVVVDVRVVIADEVEAASNRAEFIAELTPAPGDDLLQHVGTPRTFATVWHNWVRAGAADGFTIIPASIPTDVVHVSAEVITELRQRGLRSAATPELVGAAAPSSAGEVVAA